MYLIECKGSKPGINNPDLIILFVSDTPIEDLPPLGDEEFDDDDDDESSSSSQTSKDSQKWSMLFNTKLLDKSLNTHPRTKKSYFQEFKKVRNKKKKKIPTDKHFYKGLLSICFDCCSS